MDLRERKTRASIKRAFLALRAEKGLERITVRELAQRAEIGKATFYLHYHSVYDLSEALQREAVEEIVGAIADPADYLAEPDRVSRQLFEAFRTHAELIDVLFAGEQAGVLAQSIEEALREHLSVAFPQVNNDPRLSALLTFMIQGGFYAYRAAREHDKSVIAGGAPALKEASRGAAPSGPMAAEEAAIAAIAEASCTVTGLMRSDVSPA